MIRFKLKAYLEREGVPLREFARRVEGLSPKTIYTYASGTRNPTLDSLDRLITALRDVTGHPVEVADLLEYEREDALPAWRILAGFATDPDAPADMSVDHDRYIDEAIAEEHAARGRQPAGDER